MSDADGGPSTSRGTRRSGVNSPRTPGEPAAKAKKSESVDSADASTASGTPFFVNKEEKNLFTPTYGGNLFTGPTSRKREAKKNSRFSPDITPVMRQKQTVTEKLSEAAAAAVVDEPTQPELQPQTKKNTVRSLKDTIGTLQVIVQKLKQKNFSLPPKFGGKGADLYRQVLPPKPPRVEEVEVIEPGPSTSYDHRHRSLAPSRMPSLPPPARPKPLVSFGFGDAAKAPAAATPAAQQRKARGKSIPPGGVLSMREKKTAKPLQIKREPEEPEEEEEDHPPRGRKRERTEEREEDHELRVLPKMLNVKQEVLSDGEEAPVAQSARRGRNRASLPPQPSPSVVGAAATGRRKSGGMGLVVKDEPLDDDYDQPQQQKRRGRSVRAKTAQPVARPVPAEEPAMKPPPKPRGRGKRDVQEAPVAEQPSTSAAAAAAPAAPAAGRSVSRKRGRPSLTAAAAAEDDQAETSKAEEPVATRKDARRSTRSTRDSEETTEEATEEEGEREEKTSPAGAGKHRNRRTAGQMLLADLREGEKEGDVAEEGHATRRRSFRASGDEAAAAAATTKASPRVTKPVAVQPGGSLASRLQATFDDVPGVQSAESAPALAEPLDSLMDDGEMREEASGEEAKPSTSSSGLDTTAASSRMLDESTAERSGYGEEDEADQDEGMDEGAAKEEEEQASTSAAAAAVPAKRGRGRPPKAGSTPKAATTPKPKPQYMGVEPMVRGRRTTTLNNPKYQEFIASESVKHAKRASAGGGVASTPRTLAAAGVSLDLPSPRVRAPTPPPPEVKAAPGSALEIFRSIKGKTKLPSMRSPSPLADRRPTSSKAAAAATPAEAPPIDAAAAPAEREKSATPPGPSNVPASTVSPLPRRVSGASQKDEEVTLEPSSPPAAVEPPPLAEDGSSQEEKEKELPSSPVWITPDNIRGVKSKRSSQTLVQQDPLTGTLKWGQTPAEEEKTEEEKEKGEEQEEKEEEEEPKEEESPPESTAKKEEPTPAAAAAVPDGGVEEMLAKWKGSRDVIDQVRLEAGVPVLPPEPLAARATRRSINAPARFGDYDLNYGDARKRSATIASPVTLPTSPALADAKKRGKKKEEATPIRARETAGGEGEEQPSGSRARSKSKKEEKKRPRIVLKFKLGGGSASSAPHTPTAAAPEEEEEEADDGGEEPMEDEMFGEAEGDVTLASPAVTPFATPATTPATARTVRPATMRRDANGKRRPKSKPKAFAPKWKRRPIPHLGFIELDEKKVESVTLTCAAAIDDMLREVCGDGIPRSTLTMKEQASEHSRLSVAKRRAMGLIGQPTPAGSRPKPRTLPIAPREERTKRIRHAPQSKEYDNLATGVLEQQPNSPLAFQVLAGMFERKQPAERRKESRQEAALKKASVAVIERTAEAKDAETPVEKPKKEKKRDREREKSKENAPPKNSITYAELLRQKTHNMERLPGRVLSDPTDFFYRELFTDDLGEGMPDTNPLDLDVIGFTEPVPDDLKAIGPTGAIGVMAEETATKLLRLLPRPAPYPDDDYDPDEEREWMEEDMKKALADHSAERRESVNEALLVINAQRMADLAVQGTKGSQDVLYNTYVKHAYRMKEQFSVFSPYRMAESSWLHRSLLRLLPAFLLPVYLEILRFLRYIDSKLAAELSKAVQERGVDTEWDALFEQEPSTSSDDDRTQPMLLGSQPASAACSSELLPVAAAAAAADDDVSAAIEAVIKTLEKAELDAAAAAASASSAASPDSDQGGLVIDEEPQEHEKAAAAAAAEVTEGAAEVIVEDVSFVEDVVVEEIKKPDLKAVADILAEVTDKKVREANADTIHDSIDNQRLGDVIPILIAPIFDIEDAPEEFMLKNRPYEYMYRLIRYATPNPDKFKPIRPRIPAGEISVAQAMDAAVDCVIAQVKSAVKNKGNGRVILFGWGLSCYINLRVAQLQYGISAIINFAFPLKTLDGWRGTPDDDINLTYCPTLFVMGAEASDFDATQLLMLRQNMIQSPGALVLGSADSQLNISSHRLTRERITQKIAARMLLEQVIEFINLPANQLERAKLVPLQLNNVYAVELTAVKTYTSQEAQQALVTGGGGRRATHPTLPTPIHALPVHGAAVTDAQSIERRRQREKEERRKRGRVEDQTTVAGRLAQSIAASAAPISKRSRTDDLPSTSYAARIGHDYRFSVPIPSPLASPSINSPGGFRMMSRPAILSHNMPHHHQPQQYHPALPSPRAGGPSTSAAAAAASGLLTTRPAAAAAAPSPRGPLDPASISLS